MRTLVLESDGSGTSVVLTAIGELDLDTQDLFERMVADQLVSSSVIVDLEQVEFLSISALRSLMVCHEMAAPHHLVYAKPSPQARRLLRLSGVGDRLCLQDTIAAPAQWQPLAG